MMPVINHNVLNSMEILKNSLNVFSERCIKGITADEERCRDYSERSIALATVLNLHIGYSKAAEVAKEAVKSGKTVREVVLEKGLLTEEEASRILDIKKMT
jgi:fumarate hydratase class II